MAKGAEANLYRDNDRLVKERVSKKYRISPLDNALRKKRTRREARYLKKAADGGVNTPQVLKVDEDSYVFEMQYLEGRLLKDVLEQSPREEAGGYAQKIGEMLCRLHEVDLVHNDLTTSNMILSEDKIYFIDFGLAYPSRRLEDKAMDLVVFKKSLRATHPTRYEYLWRNVSRGYEISESLLKRVEKIEKRVRYS